jgi:transcriptional regulator with XRE-family HTH domain
MSSTISLADWLRSKIGDDKQFGSNRELARSVGLSDTTIRRILAGESPEIRTLKKLSNGLQYPIDQLQRMAGILADDPEVLDDTTNYINEGLKRLSPKNRRRIQKMINNLLEEQDETD